MDDLKQLVDSINYMYEICGGNKEENKAVKNMVNTAIYAAISEVQFNVRILDMGKWHDDQLGIYTLAARILRNTR